MRHRRCVPLLSGLLLFAASATPIGAPHLSLIRSAPAASQTLAASPARLQLWFSELPAPEVSRITLKRDTADIALHDTVIVDKDKSMYAEPMKTLAAGRYVAAWKTAGDDGHVLTGEIPFTVASK